MARGKVVQDDDHDDQPQVFAREVEDDEEEEEKAMKPKWWQVTFKRDVETAQAKSPLVVFVKPIAAGSRCFVWLFGMYDMFHHHALLLKFLDSSKTISEQQTVSTIATIGAIKIFFFTVALDQLIRLSESFFHKPKAAK